MNRVRHELIYQAVREEHKEYNYPIHVLCKLGGVSRAAYYKWLNREISENEQENRRLAAIIEGIHNEITR